MNCKPGDLAIMRFALGTERGTGANIGRICEVVRPVGILNSAIGPLFCWWVKMVGSPGKSKYGYPCNEGEFPDAYLTPISGVDLSEDVPTQERIEA